MALLSAVIDLVFKQQNTNNVKLTNLIILLWQVQESDLCLKTSPVVNEEWRTLFSVTNKTSVESVQLGKLEKVCVVEVPEIILGGSRDYMV